MNLKIIFVFALVVASTSAQGLRGALIGGIVDLLDGDDDQPDIAPPAVTSPPPAPKPELPVPQPENKLVEKPEEKTAEKSDDKPEQDECQEQRITITRSPFQWTYRPITKVPRHCYTVRAHAHASSSLKFVTSKNACVDEEGDAEPAVLIAKPKMTVETVETKEMNPCELRARIMKRINDARCQWSLRPITKVPRKCYTVRASASASSKFVPENSCDKVDEKPQVSIDPVPQIDELEIVKPAILIASPPQIDEPEPAILISPPPVMAEE